MCLSLSLAKAGLGLGLSRQLELGFGHCFELLLQFHHTTHSCFGWLLFYVYLCFMFGC